MLWLQVAAVRRQMAISDPERYWLAGLLEGEGTFVAGPPSRRGAPALALVMTDADVVQRVARMWDRALVAIRPRQPHHKTAYASRVRGATAAIWMRGVRRLLGARRQHQIDRALAAHSGKLRWRRPAGACTTRSCARPAAIRGLCLHHYKLWWKASRRGRVSMYAPVDAAVPIEDAEMAPLCANEPLWTAWLAGLLEGEGTFAITRGYPVIRVQMCDLDVLERAAAIMRIARISPKDVERNREHGWSPAFQIALGGARAAEWMCVLRPLMGERRTTEIDRALGAYHPIRLTQVPRWCVIPGCERTHRSRGLCHTHYMKWHRDRRLGRKPRIIPLR
jgi:hypothetical protein